MCDWFENERLHRAAQAGELPLVMELIASGCDVNAFDEMGLTPLHFAVKAEHFTVVDILLRHGANINAHDERVVGNTPLSEVANTCSLQMARLLVEAGADPAVRGWMQLNALDKAKKRKKKEGIGSVGQAVFALLQQVARRSGRG